MVKGVYTHRGVNPNTFGGVHVGYDGATHPGTPSSGDREERMLSALSGGLLGALVENGYGYSTSARVARDTMDAAANIPKGAFHGQ